MQLFVWLWHIDDVFFIQTLYEINSIRYIIKFTFESNKVNISCLDVNINLSNDHLMTNVYIKPTDCHQYLDYSSSHPNYIKCSIVYSQSLRARKRLEALHLNEIRFLKRGCPESIIDEEMKKFKFFGSKKCMGSKGVLFMVTYISSLFELT